VVTVLLAQALAENQPIADPNGYVAYCPCMGKVINNIKDS